MPTASLEARLSIFIDHATRCRSKEQVCLQCVDVGIEIAASNSALYDSAKFSDFSGVLPNVGEGDFFSNIAADAGSQHPWLLLAPRPFRCKAERCLLGE